MAEKKHASLTSPSAVLIVRWTGVRTAATALSSSGNVSCGVTNHISLPGSVMDESEFGECQESFLPDCIVATVKFVGEGIIVWGCFSRVGLGALIPVNGTLNASAYLDILNSSLGTVSGRT